MILTRTMKRNKKTIRTTCLLNTLMSIIS